MFPENWQMDSASAQHNVPARRILRRGYADVLGNRERLRNA
jgi:hypothetical protein